MQIDRLSGHWKLAVVASTLIKCELLMCTCYSVDKDQPEEGDCDVRAGLSVRYILH